jgi:hypothetical protein
MYLNEFGFVCLVLMSTGINRFEYGMATKWCMTVKEYESVPYAAHLKWGPIQVRHYICYKTCIVVPVTDRAGRSPFNVFDLKFLLVCVGVPNGVTIFEFRSD